MKKLVVSALLFFTLIASLLCAVRVAWASNVTITITTSPLSTATGSYPGYVFVDNMYVGGNPPWTYSWVVGSSHRIATLDYSTGLEHDTWLSWSDSGARDHNITVPASPTTYTANFQVQYSINGSAGSNGLISPSGTTWVTAGASQGFSVVAYTGYYVKEIDVDGSGAVYNAGGSYTYTFTNVQASHTISAVFAVWPLQFYSLQVSPSSTVPGAYLTFTGHIYYQGTSTAPSDGDYNVQVLLSGLQVGVDHTLVSGAFHIGNVQAPGSAGTYTYSCSASSVGTANFPPVTVGYMLTVSMNGAYGTVSPSSGLYNPDVVVSVQASASSGYYLDHWLVDSSYLYTDNPHNVTMDTDHAIEAFFYVSVPGSDTTPPTFGSATSNTTVAGANVNVTCPVSDNVALSKYWFSWNNTGPWVNQTKVSASGTTVTASLNGVWNDTIGNTVSVKVYANDTSNNVAVSGTSNFLLLDGIAPTFGSIGINSTTAGSTALFSALLSDNVNVSGFIFESNMSGALVNSTWTCFTVFYSSTSAYSNISSILPGVVSNIVAWQFFGNDTANNWAATGLEYSTLTAVSVTTYDVTCRVSSGGLLYVNGVLTADGSVLNCTSASSLSLAAVANSDYSFAGFSWTGGNSASSPASYVVSGNDTVWTFFNAVSVSPPGGGSPSPPSLPVVHVGDGYVTVVQGGLASFDLTVTWTGGGTLTVSVVQASGNFSSWISASLPKSDSSGVLTLQLTCSVPSDTVLTGYSVPVSLTVQTSAGGQVVSGMLYVTVITMAQQFTPLEIAMTIIFTIIAFVTGFIGYVLEPLRRFFR